MSQAQQETIYEQALWHFDNNFPGDLDRHQAYVYTGMYIGWLIRKNLLNEGLSARIAPFLEKFRNGDLSAAAVYRDALNGVFSSESLHADVAAFTTWYLDGDSGHYPLDYEITLAGGLPTIYHVADTPENFEKIFAVIDKCYCAWNTVPPRLEGTWAGEYTYGEGYPDEVKGTTQQFSMTLSDEDGMITGHCTEEKDGKTAIAEITGFIENNFLSLVKKYQNQFLTDQHGDPLDAVPEIHYAGSFFGEAFEGAWEIEWKEVDENGAWLEYTTFGTWQMRKA